MESASNFCLVLVTAPDLKVARMLAQAALTLRLVACANLVPSVESHYWWKGRIERSGEILILFKTTAPKLAALEKLIVDRHPYDTPEFLVTRVNRGNKRYLRWLQTAVL
jgi:periplasmic divalent cation tolerance protein